MKLVTTKFKSGGLHEKHVVEKYGKIILSWMERILSRNRCTKTDVEAIKFSSPSPLKSRQTHTARTEAKVQVRKS